MGESDVLKWFKTFTPMYLKEETIYYLDYGAIEIKLVVPKQIVFRPFIFN